MITIDRIGNALQRFFENMAKARVNSVLLGMDRERLADMGYSYELLQQGPKAWPWREPTQDGAAQHETTTRTAAESPAYFEPARAVSREPASAVNRDAA